LIVTRPEFFRGSNSIQYHRPRHTHIGEPVRQTEISESRRRLRGKSFFPDIHKDSDSAAQYARRRQFMPVPGPMPKNARSLQNTA
jgi:hypothetical protein